MDNFNFMLKSFFIVGKESTKYLFNKNYTQTVKNIVEQLADENIFYVKMFQSLSTNQNLLNDELISFLTNYTDKVPYTDDEIDLDALNELERTTFCTDNEITLIKKTPINSGMISLVFEGRLNYKKIVIKVLRKNIVKKMNDAFHKMEYLIKQISILPYFKNLNIIDMFNENKEIILNQVNFSDEVKNINLLREKWADIPYIVVPKVYPSFTEINPNIIVMKYLSGIKLVDVKQEDKDTYSNLLAKFNFKSIFFDGVYHGDLHQGNILFMKKKNEYKIGIIDMGIIGKMTQEEQDKYFTFFNYIVKKDYESVVLKGLINMVEPKEVADNLSEKEISEITEKLVVVLKTACHVKQQVGAEELYTLNKTLREYGLQLTKSFCKMELSLAIIDSVCKELTGEIGYVECVERAFHELFPSELLDY